MPSLATRRAACTHLAMERLYGNFRCNVCHRFSELGWVYSCIQDDERHTSPGKDSYPEISSELESLLKGLSDLQNSIKYGSNPPEGVADEPPSKPTDTDLVMPTPQLSPSVEKAIKEGHYTLEQVAILRAQKQHVVDTARTAIERFDQSQTTDPPSQTTATSQSLDPNPHLPIPIIHEVSETPAKDTMATAPLFKESKLPMFPYCKFRACQLCRPTYRDRTWQCLEESFEKDAPISIYHLDGTQNRSFASASLMRKIGLRPTPRPRRPTFRSNDDSLLLFDEEGNVAFRNRSYNDYPAVPDSTDVADANVEPESRGFRESMKRAFKGMLVNRAGSVRSVRKRKARESTSDVDAAEFDMGLWKELNDELLHEASSVPLPTNSCVDELSDAMEEADIGGVAVTEEAADLNAADIIMSA